jgi:hypothetical protein
MSLPQLVGLNCVICQKGIPSIMDGTFCDECGNPVHRKCLDGAQPGPADKCHRCGGDPASNIAKEFRQQRGRESQIKSSGGVNVVYPVSKDCPQCGSGKYTRRRPQGWVSFAWDRVCDECGNRYSPPTPLWGSVLFILTGVLLGGFGTITVLMRILTGHPCTIPAGLFEGFLGVIGILALIQGARGLFNPGKV